MKSFLLFGLLIFISNNVNCFGQKNSTLGRIKETNSCCSCNETRTNPVTTIVQNVKIISERQPFRLPGSINPVSYRLSIQIDFNRLKFKWRGILLGNISIQISALNRTDVIYLHQEQNINFSQVTVRNVNGKEENLTKNFFNFQGILQINLKSNLSIGNKYLIEITNFKSVYRHNEGGGILLRKYQNGNGGLELMLATQFQPEFARNVFPCFDDPRFKSKFQLNITSNPEYSFLSNMPEIFCQNHSYSSKKVWKTCVFQETPIMSVYNLVFAIVNFSHVEKTDDKGRRFRIWTRKSQIHKTKLALETTINAFKILEETLKIDFPLKKIDSLAIPNEHNFNGMEHYGLITYSEPVLTWSDQFPFSSSKYFCVVIICHEVSHQWFGNLVTTSWWQDLWLNEGFTSYYAHKIAKRILKDELSYSLEVISTVNYVRYFDDYFALKKATISAPVDENVLSKFNYLSYKKGFVIVNMFENILGPKSFDSSMINYLNKNQYKSIDPADLYKSLNEATNIPISDVINEWLHKVFYPIVKVNSINNIIHISQNASVNLKTAHFQIKLNYITDKWKIPFYIMYGNNTYQNREKIRIFNKSFDTLKLDQFNISNHWLIININYGSFFTTDFDQLMFNRLKTQLLLNHTVIPPMNRAQIMQDFYDSSKKFQRNNLAELLKLFIYLRNETDPVPMVTAVNLLDKLNGLLEFRYFYPTWVKYVTFVLQPSLDKLVSEFQNDFRDSNSTYFTLRQLLLNLACKLRLSHCTKITDKIVKRWQKNKLLRSDYDLLHIALCKYVEMDNTGDGWFSIYGSQKFETWDFITSKYYAMGCSKVPWIIEKNIDIAFNVLKRKTYRIKYPHVSGITLDHMPRDHLQGITPLNSILILSLIYNIPNSMHFFNRIGQSGINYAYGLMENPPVLQSSNSIIEYAIPTTSHYNFLVYVGNSGNKSKSVFFIEAKSNIDWILKNYDIEKHIFGIMM